MQLRLVKGTARYRSSMAAWEGTGRQLALGGEAQLSGTRVEMQLGLGWGIMGSKKGA